MFKNSRNALTSNLVDSTALNISHKASTLGLTLMEAEATAKILGLLY